MAGEVRWRRREDPPLEPLRVEAPCCPAAPAEPPPRLSAVSALLPRPPSSSLNPSSRSSSSPLEYPPPSFFRSRRKLASIAQWSVMCVQRACVGGRSSLGITMGLSSTLLGLHPAKINRKDETSLACWPAPPLKNPGPTPTRRHSACPQPLKRARPLSHSHTLARAFSLSHAHRYVRPEWGRGLDTSAERRDRHRHSHKVLARAAHTRADSRAPTSTHVSTCPNLIAQASMCVRVLLRASMRVRECVCVRNACVCVIPRASMASSHVRHKPLPAPRVVMSCSPLRHTRCSCFNMPLAAQMRGGGAELVGCGW